MKTLATLFALAFIFTPALAEDTYDLSDPEPVVGLKTESKSAMKGTDGKMALTVGGETLAKGTMSFNSSQTAITEVTKVKDGVITEYTETITAYEIQSDSQFLDEQNSERKTTPLLNAVVTYTLIDGEYIPDLPDATEEQLEELDADLYSDAELYPKQPVKIGESWELDEAAIAAILDQPVDGEGEGKGRLKFVGVEDFNGEPCAVIEGELELKAPMEDRDLPEGVDSGWIAIKVSGRVYRSLKHRIDVGGKLAGDIQYGYVNNEDGVDYIMTVDLKGELSGTDQIID